MKLLLDEHFSHRLRPLLVGHDVYTVKHMGWRGIQNGQLLAKTAAEGFDALLTMDAGIQYQQNLTALPCTVTLLKAESNALEHIKPLVPAILKALVNMPRNALIPVG
jgi:hypothetical protein